MPKICLVGAGSTVFAQNILGDVLSTQRGSDYVISLFDIDPERLKTSEIVARRICESLKLSSVRIDATLDRREALRGSDFVILMMQVGGYKFSYRHGLRHSEKIWLASDDRRHPWHRGYFPRFADDTSP